MARGRRAKWSRGGEGEGERQAGRGRGGGRRQVDKEGFVLLRHLVVEQRHLDGCREGSGEGVRTRSWEGLPSKRGRHREDGRTLPAREAEAARHGGVGVARVRGAVPRLVLDASLPVEPSAVQTNTASADMLQHRRRHRHRRRRRPQAVMRSVETRVVLRLQDIRIAARRQGTASRTSSKLLPGAARISVGHTTNCVQGRSVIFTVNQLNVFNRDSLVVCSMCHGWRNKSKLHREVSARWFPFCYRTCDSDRCATHNLTIL